MLSCCGPGSWPAVVEGGCGSACIQPFHPARWLASTPSNLPAGLHPTRPNLPAGLHPTPPTCLQRGIDLKKIAEQMTGSSGAELKAVCTEAGMFALRERRVHVTQVRCGCCCCEAARLEGSFLCRLQRKHVHCKQGCSVAVVHPVECLSPHPHCKWLLLLSAGGL